MVSSARVTIAQTVVAFSTKRNLNSRHNFKNFTLQIRNADTFADENRKHIADISGF
jgi:hypothetical protein